MSVVNILIGAKQSLLRTFFVMSLAAVVNAAPITWGTVTDISNDLSSLNQVGGIEQAYDLGRTTGGTVTVGGVNFAQDPGTIVTSPSHQTLIDTNISTNDAFWDPDGAGPLTSPLDSFVWRSNAANGNGDMAITLTGLVVGGDYRVQLFVVDQRAAGNGRTQTFDDDVPATPASASVRHNSVPGPGPAHGQYVIGFFQASASTQVINIARVGTTTATILNALILRRVVPELNVFGAVIPLSLVGLLLLCWAERRRIGGLQ